MLISSVRLCCNLDDAIALDKERAHVALEKQKVSHAAKNTERWLVGEHVTHDGAAGRRLKVMMMLHAAKGAAKHGIGEVNRSLESRDANGK